MIHLLAELPLNQTLTLSVKATAIGMSSPWVRVRGLGPLEEAKLSTGDMVPRPGNDDQLSDDFKILLEAVIEKNMPD